MASTTGVRLTLKFNFLQQIRGCGWSENYDLGYASLPVAIANKNRIAAFIKDRSLCLGIGPFIVEAILRAYVQPLTPGARPVRRASLSFPVPPFPGNGLAYNPAFSADEEYDADYGQTVLYLNVQTNLSGTPVYRRNIWIAGLPDKADLSLKRALTDPSTDQAVQEFVKDLDGTGIKIAATNQVSIRSTDQSAGNPTKPCTAWTIGPPSLFTVPAHGLVVGQPVLAEGCTVAPGGFAPRGRYLVGTVLDANTITLAGLKQLSTPINTGGFRPDIKTFNTISVVTVEGMTKRNKGRPSGLAVGRQPKKRTVRA